MASSSLTAGVVFALVIAVIGIFAPLLAPHHPLEASFGVSLPFDINLGWAVVCSSDRVGGGVFGFPAYGPGLRARPYSVYGRGHPSDVHEVQSDWFEGVTHNDFRWRPWGAAG